MQRTRRQKDAQPHLAILVNARAARFDQNTLDSLISEMRRRNIQYTVQRPSSAGELLDIANAVCGLKGARRHPQVSHRGQPTGLVVAGGDGSFNLVARAAMAADLPVAALPMGRFNNIARSLYGSTEAAVVIAKIVGLGYTTIDVATAGGQPFFGAIGLGLLPQMAQLLAKAKVPRTGIGWSRLAGHAAEQVSTKKAVIKIDAFRFDLIPTILNVHLLPYALGLPMTSASLPSDGLVEVIFDAEASVQGLAGFVRQVSRSKYCYGREVRLFRGSQVTIQPSRGRTLYLDGELIDVPDNVLDIKMADRKLKVFQ